MDRWGMNEMAGRDDALAWAILLMAAHLEQSGHLEGNRYRRDLRVHADNQGRAGKAESASALRTFASLLEQEAGQTGR